MGPKFRFDIVVPTLGRRSLEALLESLADAPGPPPDRIILVLDRGPATRPVTAPRLRGRTEVLPSRGLGPAAARNVGWRASRAEWVVFLDDDVVPSAGWLDCLEKDLRGLQAEVAASQGRLRVPLADHRRPTDWERNVQALETARWTTADLAVRRDALARVGGFDERFRRAYREDADLALRLQAAGYRLVRGRRGVVHPVRPESRLVSVRLQAGNADDALMEALHGGDWYARAGAARGRRRIHFATTATGAAALVSLLFGWRRAGLALGAWLAATLELTWRRVAPGPRTPGEVLTMLGTSALVPPAATLYWLAGRLRARTLVATGPQPAAKPRPRAVLLDRDGTLVVNVPYNGDPRRVVPMPGARGALERLRAAGLSLAVISNQSGVGRGRITREQVDQVAARIEELLGPVEAWAVCPHAPDDGCDCRKPAPGLVMQAASALGVAPEECVVIGDIGSDVEAARAAGARAILVPTDATRREEILEAPEVAPDLDRAVDLVLAEAP